MTTLDYLPWHRPASYDSATPPGAGVHGMCGFNAAETALKNI